MKEQFVTYEIAKELKELGFNEECFAEYFNNGEITLTNGKETFIKAVKENKVIACKAPLWQQAFQWLRFRKLLTAEVCISAHKRNDPDKWMFSITYLDHDALYEHSKQTYFCYEGAEEGCLTRMIEICKNK